MRYQPNRDYVSNDEVQTPPALARQLVDHFQPRGRILEPCAGDGNFLRALRRHARRPALPSRRTRHPTTVAWCEIKDGRDFFSWHEKVDWIVTNPPWSEIRAFLQHAMTVADEVVFLLTVNHVWTKARIRDMAAAGFGLREIVLVDMPPNFPQSGFQLGAVYVSRGWQGPIQLTWGSRAQPVEGTSGRDGDCCQSRSRADEESNGRVRRGWTRSNGE